MRRAHVTTISSIDALKRSVGEMEQQLNTSRIKIKCLYASLSAYRNAIYDILVLTNCDDCTPEGIQAIISRYDLGKARK